MRPLLTLVLLFAATAAPHAWEDDYDNDRSADSASSRYIQASPNYNYGSDSTYRGYIENSDGYTQMRDAYGNTLHGYVGQDGYGTVYDQQSQPYQVHP